MSGSNLEFHLWLPDLKFDLTIFKSSSSHPISIPLAKIIEV
jgi:hypothetical protein